MAHSINPIPAVAPTMNGNNWGHQNIGLDIWVKQTSSGMDPIPVLKFREYPPGFKNYFEGVKRSNASQIDSLKYVAFLHVCLC